MALRAGMHQTSAARLLCQSACCRERDPERVSDLAGGLAVLACPLDDRPQVVSHPQNTPSALAMRPVAVPPPPPPPPPPLPPAKNSRIAGRFDAATMSPAPSRAYRMI